VFYIRIQKFEKKILEHYSEIIELCTDRDKFLENNSIPSIYTKIKEVKKNFDFMSKELPTFAEFAQKYTMERLFEMVNSEILINKHIEKVPCEL
jgi:hypothetical protein